ncbi:hypothetical protein N2152v2_009452 [Parachlorella kessleri]
MEQQEGAEEGPAEEGAAEADGLHADQAAVPQHLPEVEAADHMPATVEQQQQPAADSHGHQAPEDPRPEHQHQQVDDHQGLPADGEAGYQGYNGEAAQPDPSSKLNELEAFLRQPDAVMEPNIMDRLREYVMAHGHPQQAVEYLTDSYVGYAQMASLVCAWLKLTDEDAQGGAAAAAEPGGHAGPPSKKQRLDEAFYLRQLAKERFDPQRFAGIFSSGGSGAPQWLNGLIAEKEGRQLIYELSAQYKNSLLLNFAIQKILMQPGREQEVAAVGSSLAGFFGVFHRLLAARLKEATQAGERQLHSLCEELKDSCCQSQHTYVHAQLLLRELSRHPRGARFRRLSQELELHAAAQQGGVVWRMRQWLQDPGMSPADSQASSLLCDLLAGAAAGGATSTSEIIKLHQMYSPQGQAAPPSIHLLRHPRVFEVLLQGLFHPGRQLGPDAQQAYITLLSLAAAARDDRASDGGLDLSAVAGTRAALETAASVSYRALLDQKVSQEEVAAAGEAVQYPCCAAGVLHIMGVQLTRQDYWQQSYHLVKSPPFLVLLYHVVAHQPLLHDKVLDLLSRVLAALGNSDHDMAKGFLDVAVRLLQGEGSRVLSVMHFAERWKQQADPSLVRHFVFKVLEVAAPPYSTEFAGAMLRIMMSAGIRRQRMTSRDWAVKALLDEFAAACTQDVVVVQQRSMTKSYEYLVEVAPPRPANGDIPATGPTYRPAIAAKGPPTIPGVTTLYENFKASREKYPSNKCLGHVEGGAYQWLTYEQTGEQVDAIGSAMAAVGVGPHGRCGIYGANSPQWMIAMQACNRQTVYCVPLYDTLGENAIEYIIVHSESSIVFSSSEKLGVLVAALKHEAVKAMVKTVVYWGKGDAAAVEAAKGLGFQIYSFDEFLELGRKNPSPAGKRLLPPKPEDYCTIMYTSGTTGDPKGTVLTHANLVAIVASRKRVFNALGVLLTHASTLAVVGSVKLFLNSLEGMVMDEKDVYMSFLPLAHIFDRTAEEFYLHLGASIGFWRGDIKGLVEDIGLLKPTIFPGVPRVFDRIYTGVMAKIAEGSFLKRLLFQWGYSRKVAQLARGAHWDKATPIFDSVVFSKVKERLGGRVRLIISGGAPLSRHVEDFLRVCMCCRVVQGYGLTETCAASFIAVPDVVDHFGTVGPPQPVHEFRLEAVPEMTYDPTADPARGEVCVRGPNVFTGYYKDEEKTREVLDPDGWFHTGDIGELTATGALRIIDRKKNIFKLSQGEYVAVEKVEGVYKQNPYVEQIWVYGNSFESTLVAVVVPLADKLAAWAKEQGLSGSLAELCHEDRVKKMLLGDLNSTAKAGKLKGCELVKAVYLESEALSLENELLSFASGYELVKAVYLESELFSVENELLTPTFKLKRPQLQKKYQGEIDAMYAALKKS